MNKKNNAAIALFTLMLAEPALATDSGFENSIEVGQLSLAAAIQAADVSISSCRKKDHQVSVTVVDSFGQAQVVLRDTKASPISLELSKKKAFTAVNFRKNTAQLAHLADTAVGRSEGVLMSAGGVLIKVDDKIYGAVGVSGSSSGASDDTCATTGAEAIMDALKEDLQKAEVTKEVISVDEKKE